MGVGETRKVKLQERRRKKMRAWCFCRREGAMMSSVVRAFDWEGDRGGCGRVGGAFDVCVCVCSCVHVCVCVQEDNGWPWKMHQWLWGCPVWRDCLLIGRYSVIEVHVWAKAQYQALSTDTVHIRGLHFHAQTHTHTRPHAIIPRSLLNYYSTSGHCYIRGCSQTEFFGLTSIIVQANRMSECVIPSPAPVSLSAAWVWSG